MADCNACFIRAAILIGIRDRETYMGLRSFIKEMFCDHHWICIKPPPFSRRKCKKCEREEYWSGHVYTKSLKEW